MIWSWLCIMPPDSIRTSKSLIKWLFCGFCLQCTNHNVWWPMSPDSNSFRIRINHVVGFKTVSIVIMDVTLVSFMDFGHRGFRNRNTTYSVFGSLVENSFFYWIVYNVIASPMEKTSTATIIHSSYRTTTAWPEEVAWEPAIWTLRSIWRDLLTEKLSNLKYFES